MGEDGGKSKVVGEDLPSVDEFLMMCRRVGGMAFGDEVFDVMDGKGEGNLLEMELGEGRALQDDVHRHQKRGQGTERKEKDEENGGERESWRSELAHNGKRERRGKRKPRGREI